MKVYISAPITILQDKLSEVWHKLNGSRDIQASYWQRGTEYTDKALVEADAVVFILPSFKFKHSISGMTRGSQSELKKAVELKKPIYIAYYTQGASIGQYVGLYIYNTTVDAIMISGIGGTSDHIFEAAREFNENKAVKVDLLAEQYGKKEPVVFDIESTGLMQPSDHIATIYTPLAASNKGKSLMMLLIGKKLS